MPLPNFRQLISKYEIELSAHFTLFQSHFYVIQLHFYIIQWVIPLKKPNIQFYIATDHVQYTTYKNT